MDWKNAIKTDVRNPKDSHKATKRRKDNDDKKFLWNHLFFIDYEKKIMAEKKNNTKWKEMYFL